MNSFYGKLIQSLDDNLYNYHLDNYDYHRFKKKSVSIKDRVMKLLSHIGLLNRSISLSKLSQLYPHYEGLNRLFHGLDDDQSKELLVHIFAYRLLGYRKVKLPLSTSQYWKDLERLEKLGDRSDFLDPKFEHFVLNKFDLHPVGFEIKFYYSARGIMQDFIARQYEYRNHRKHIKVKPGDVVIDGGGCWGDTALYFAHETAERGHVFSFEFVRSNIEIFNRNVALNPGLAKRIDLIQQPLWSKSDVPMYVLDRGPASQVSFNEIDGSEVVKTTCIDNLVANGKCSKVNFLKLDVEGAELEVLKGAEHSIRRFKPVLAVAVYHREEDFYNIYDWILNLGMGYRFFLGHYTIHKEESILFAEI